MKRRLAMRSLAPTQLFAQLRSNNDMLPLADAAIFSPLDRARCAVHWKRQHDELAEFIREYGADILGEEDFAFLNHDHAAEEWSVPPSMTLEQIENQVITTTLHRTHGNVKEAASILGIDRSTLYDRLKKYHLPRA